ncbi:5755_t:CDS:2 [Diversispora eburnea]|uniref:5755_t:CDS:1 n=1 Tax=Diversispora eburnea TaxID=1213867 RepID=A0A9N8YNH2_9GLOM|nr:5755_t:CDS:2 [Diversispora eburnea]
MVIQKNTVTSQTNLSTAGFTDVFGSSTKEFIKEFSFESKTHKNNKLDSHPVYLLKFTQTEFSVMTMRRFKKDEFILQHIGDKAMTENFLHLKHEYSDLNIYYNCFMENHRNNTMSTLNGNIFAPFIHRCDKPNCYIQITKDDRINSRNNNENSLYRVGIFASVDIEQGVELTLGLNVKEKSNLIPLNSYQKHSLTNTKGKSTTVNSTTNTKANTKTVNTITVNTKKANLTTNPTINTKITNTKAATHLTLNSDSIKPDLSKDPFPMSFQITMEERQNHNKFRNLITAIQILENSIVNYCIKHSSDPLVSSTEKLTTTTIILFGLPQSTFSRIHTIISICLQEHITIEQCQTCLLNAFRLFSEWKTNSSTTITINESLLNSAFDVIPIPVYKWSEKLNISKYKLVKWELECLKAVRFEVVITSVLYFCWLARICDELEV